MAKKNANPAEAFRKAQRKKELKKNKATRSQARDFSLVKKDTWDLQDEIERLESVGKPDQEEKERLLQLKAELEKINKKKAEYVAEHPEHRRLVYRPRKETDTAKLEQELVSAKPMRNLFLPNGLPRHPERSAYYDPVMNPFGVAPPGMPYRERDLMPGEIDSDAESEDDDIIMPEGPPPADGEDPVGSDEDIPMPDDGEEADEIPLPSQSALSPGFVPMIPSFPSGVPLPPPFSSGMLPPPPPFPMVSIPPAVAGQLSHPPPYFMTPPPPGFFPRGTPTSGSFQDPLTCIPHQTFQGHQSQTRPPAKPQFNPSSLQAMAATVSAAPQLRDLKKEATSFVPTSLNRKKGASAVAGSSRINAAPGVGDDAADAPRPDLLSALAGHFSIPTPTPSSSVPPKNKTQAERTKDDYAKFVEEMEDVLAPK